MSSDVYLSFFGFSERPFALVPDADFIFWSGQHKRAFLVLEYGVATRAPITVVTGEIGTGKTTLLQHLLRTIESDTTIGLISNAQGGRGDLLRWVLYALSVEAGADDDYITLFKKFQEFVVGEYAAGRFVMLVIDEAQNLSVEALEELRMLTNINSNKDELLQLVLLGQPELKQLIARPELVQFAQRVVVKFHLQAFDAATTHKYIVHRLQHAGGTGNEFSAASIQAVFKLSKGVPRVINKVCDLALVYASGDDKTVVDAEVVMDLVKDGLFAEPIETNVYILDNPIFSSSHRKVAE